MRVQSSWSHHLHAQDTEGGMPCLLAHTWLNFSPSFIQSRILTREWFLKQWANLPISIKVTKANQGNPM